MGVIERGKEFIESSLPQILEISLNILEISEVFYICTYPKLSGYINDSTDFQSTRNKEEFSLIRDGKKQVFFNGIDFSNREAKAKAERLRKRILLEIGFVFVYDNISDNHIEVNFSFDKEGWVSVSFSSIYHGTEEENQSLLEYFGISLDKKYSYDETMDLLRSAVEINRKTPIGFVGRHY